MRKTEVDSVTIPSGELSLAIVLCILSWVISWPWSIVAAIASIAVASAIFYDRLKRWKRSRLLKHPFETHFLIPKSTEHKLDYYVQDDEIHLPDEITLRANTENDVIVWMKPQADLVMSELQLGCLGSIESKPEPLHFFNPWVKRGVIRERHPEKDESNYVDVTNIYHVAQRNRTWPKDEVMLSGLKIKTKERGDYVFWIGYVMPEGRGEVKSLTIHVK